MKAFGYGDEALNAHHNYWEERPLLDIAEPDVKWLALTRREPVTPGEPAALLLLQGYNRTEARDAAITRIPFAAGVLRDIESGEEIPVSGAAATVRLPAPYGTRMFHLIARPAERGP
jgi:hypothetical protein